MVAVVGPSGCGKSTFLDVISHRKSLGVISGDREYNHKPASQKLLRNISSYVTQEDIFHPTQTVLEAVMFQANLRLDPSIPRPKKVLKAMELIALAGLRGKENQRVGGLLPGGIRFPGLSGGEKRRLSLCCGTITDPDILFADEATSGAWVVPSV